VFGAASEKTEKPTAKRLSEARKSGQVAKSTDLMAAITLSALCLSMVWLGSQTAAHMTAFMQRTFSALAYLPQHPLSIPGLMRWMTQVGELFLSLAGPFVLIALASGILAGLLQVRPLFTIKPLLPQWARLNPVQGLQRMLQSENWVNALKGLVKMAVVAVPAWMLCQANFPRLMLLSQAPVLEGARVILELLGQLALWCCIAFFVVGLADWWHQRHVLMKRLGMTKQEVRDEKKQEDGNGAVRGRIRRMGQQLVQRQMVSRVPKADVVITNPTHYAIALQYDPDLAPAPRVIAKGVDHLALKIREVAKANGVPTVENKPLARSLYKSVEVDQMIPPALFLAVAEVLAYVFSKNKGRRLNRKSLPAKGVQPARGPANGPS
jgi:flagellar biosynthetic protein FlhB